MLADDVLRNAEKNFGCKLPTALHRAFKNSNFKSPAL